MVSSLLRSRWNGGMDRCCLRNVYSMAWAGRGAGRAGTRGMERQDAQLIWARRLLGFRADDAPAA
jgi:hypothetical protein